jgi:adenine-specific DNA methylase
LNSSFEIATFEVNIFNQRKKRYSKSKITQQHLDFISKEDHSAILVNYKNSCLLSEEEIKKQQNCDKDKDKDRDRSRCTNCIII